MVAEVGYIRLRLGARNTARSPIIRALSPACRFLYGPPDNSAGQGNMAVTTRYDQRQLAPARNLGAILDFAARSHARAAGGLILVALINFLPGFFDIPPIDRHQAPSAQPPHHLITHPHYLHTRSQ